eukprot:677227_1
MMYWIHCAAKKRLKEELSAVMRITGFVHVECQETEDLVMDDIKAKDRAYLVRYLWRIKAMDTLVIWQRLIMHCCCSHFDATTDTAAGFDDDEAFPEPDIDVVSAMDVDQSLASPDAPDSV